MTTQDVAILAVAAGTCWTFIIQLSIRHAASRIIKCMDELGKKLDLISR